MRGALTGTAQGRRLHKGLLGEDQWGEDRSPELAKVIKRLEAGDVLMVTRLDRLARSYSCCCACWPGCQSDLSRNGCTDKGCDDGGLRDRVSDRCHAGERQSEIEAAFRALVRNRADALLVGADPFILSRRLLIATLAARHALPAVYTQREFVDAGGLLSYGASTTEAYR